MINYLLTKFRQFRCDHSTFWYNPVYPLAGASPWKYCCACGLSDLMDKHDWSGSNEKIVHRLTPTVIQCVEANTGRPFSVKRLIQISHELERTDDDDHEKADRQS